MLHTDLDKMWSEYTTYSKMYDNILYFKQGGGTNKILHQRLSVAVLDIKGNYRLERKFTRGGGVKSRPEILEKT